MQSSLEANRPAFEHRRDRKETFEQTLVLCVRRGLPMATRMLGSTAEAQDACQQTAAHLLAEQHRYDPTRPLGPWFNRLLRNHCVDRLRRRKRRARPGLEEPRVADGRALHRAAMASPESSCARREIQTIVSRALATLQDDLREMIDLRHFREMSYDQMARQARIPRGTVMSRLHRARKTLREVVRTMLLPPPSGPQPAASAA